MGCTASISSKLEWQYTYALSIWSVVTKSFMRVTSKESLLALDLKAGTGWGKACAQMCRTVEYTFGCHTSHITRLIGR